MLALLLQRAIVVAGALITACATNPEPRNTRAPTPPVRAQMPEPPPVVRGPVALEILMDVSGSMYALADPALSPPDLPKARRKDIADRTAIQLIEKRGGDSLGVTLFAKSTAHLEAARNDPQALIGAIRNLPNRAVDAEASDLLLGLAEALDTLGATNASSKELIVLTDGDVNDATSEASDPVRDAAKLGVHVVIVQIGRIEDTQVVSAIDLFNVPRFVPMHVAINHALLTRVTAGTGGERMIVSDASTLESIVAQLGRRETKP